MAEFELKALITGVDRLSPALSKMQKKIRGFKRQAEEASQGGLALGGGLAAGLTFSLKSYADQENAATGLKVAMMDANGEVGKSFQDINKLAIGLGNQLSRYFCRRHRQAKISLSRCRKCGVPGNAFMVTPATWSP